MATTVPMLAPDGTSGDIPQDRVQDALKAGFKQAVEMTSPDGKAGYIPAERQQDAINAGFKVKQSSPDLSNKQGQGTYNMWDTAGQMHPVPYSQVPMAAHSGYRFDTNPTKTGLTPSQQFQKDFNYATTGPGNEAAFAQSDKNAPLPMQLVSGGLKGLGTMYKPAIDVIGAATGVPQQSINSSLEFQTPAEAVGKFGTMGAVAAPGVMAAPLATAGAAVGGTLAGTGANAIAHAAGASQRTTDLVTDAAGLVGGAGGALAAQPVASAVASRFSPETMKEMAGGLLQSVAHDANKIPVNLENAGDSAVELMKWQDKTNLGPTVNKFLNRITNPKKGSMTYEEARDFYQLLGDMSVDETKKIAPPIRYDLTRMIVGLKQDIGNAADQVGRAADYYKGLGDYARASRLQEWYDGAKDVLSKELVKGVIKGAGLGLGGTIGYEIYKKAQ